MAIRTEDEVKAVMGNWDTSKNDDYMHPQDLAWNDAAFTGCVMFLQKAPEEREAWLLRRKDWSEKYTSWGDDERDAEESGYSVITRWLLGEFEWSENGDALLPVSGA